MLLVHFTPVQITSVQCQDQRLRCRDIRCNWYIVHIAKFNNVIDIRFVRTGCQRISEKDEQIYIIVLNLGSELLFSTQMSCQELEYLN